MSAASNTPVVNMTPTNDLSQRISMGTWHPKENTFAVAKHNSLYIYTEKRESNHARASRTNQSQRLQRGE